MPLVFIHECAWIQMFPSALELFVGTTGLGVPTVAAQWIQRIACPLLSKNSLHCSTHSMMTSIADSIHAYMDTSVAFE